MESHGLVCEAPEPVQHANMTQAALEEFFTKAIEAGFFKDISGVQFPTSLMSPDSCVLSFLHVHLPSPPSAHHLLPFWPRSRHFSIRSMVIENGNEIHTYSCCAGHLPHGNMCNNDICDDL